MPRTVKTLIDDFQDARLDEARDWSASDLARETAEASTRSRAAVEARLLAELLRAGPVVEEEAGTLYVYQASPLSRSVVIRVARDASALAGADADTPIPPPDIAGDDEPEGFAADDSFGPVS